MDKNTRNTQKLSSIILVAMILVPGVIGLLTRWANPVDLLNGQPSKFASVVDFTRNYGNTFNGNFFLRDDLIRLDYWSRYFILGETVFPQVLLGSDGWMYYTDEGNLDYFQRVKPFTRDQTNLISDRLRMIQNELADKNITFLFVIAPNKETIYPEYLPEGISVTDNPAWADQVIQSLGGSDVRVLDLRTVLLAEKQRSPVYFKTDTHWNPVGARAAYDAILTSLQPDFPILVPHPLKDFNQVIETASGDLAGLIHLKGDVTESFTALHARFEKPSLGLKDPPPGQMITVMPNAALPKAVIFRDSFFNGLQPFTSEHFSRVVYVSDFAYNPDLIANENPDIVILEVAERYLSQLLDF